MLLCSLICLLSNIPSLPSLSPISHSQTAFNIYFIFTTKCLVGNRARGDGVFQREEMEKSFPYRLRTLATEIDKVNPRSRAEKWTKNSDSLSTPPAANIASSWKMTKNKYYSPREMTHKTFSNRHNSKELNDKKKRRRDENEMRKNGKFLLSISFLFLSFFGVW